MHCLSVDVGLPVFRRPTVVAGAVAFPSTCSATDVTIYFLDWSCRSVPCFKFAAWIGPLTTREGNFGFWRSSFELRVFVLFVDFDFPLATFGLSGCEMSSSEEDGVPDAPGQTLKAIENRAPHRCKVCRVPIKEHFGPHGRHWRVMLLFSKLNAFGSAARNAS